MTRVALFSGALPQGGGVRVAEVGQRENHGTFSEAGARCREEGHLSQTPQVRRGCIFSQRLPDFASRAVNSHSTCFEK